MTIKQIAAKAQEAADLAAERAIELDDHVLLEQAGLAQAAATAAAEARYVKDAEEQRGIAEAILQSITNEQVVVREEMTPLEEIIELGYGPIWKVGQGSRHMRVIARNQGDALAKAAMIDPILLAIGMVAELETDVEGCPVVALIPEDFEF